MLLLHGKSDQPIDMSVARDDSMLVISVADRGPGLAPGEENKVFRKILSRSRDSPGGLGLGLWIARQLVEAHGGQIAAQNRERWRRDFSFVFHC